ncbi:condensation domain-containing protein [Streptomyces sp. NPDC052042]|uniref:condensation domain-containing protein n=1 Tax=Streptomyces sp. NPDC052042 TaxID=3365683 RepID=UPI0037D3ECF9
MKPDEQVVHDLVSALRRHAVTARAEGGNLRLDGAVGQLPQEILGRLRIHKTAVLDLLGRTSGQMERTGGHVPLGPLSVAQQAAVAAEHDPGSARAVLSRSARCAGRLDAASLHAAFTRLCARHENLLAVLTADGTGLRPPGEEPVRRTRQTDPAAFDLRTGPAFLLKVHEERDGTRVELIAHPLVADERTLALALDELAALYGGREQTTAPVSHAEFTAAQARYLAHPATAARRHALPTAGHALRTPARATARHIAPEPGTAVTAFAPELGVTVPILRLGAFLLAVRRLRLADTVAVEQPNRSPGPFAEVLGPVATTALIAVPEARTVREFLAAVRDRVLDAHEARDLPADVPAGQVPRVRFAHRSGPVDGPDFAGTPSTLLPGETDLPCGDLSFVHAESVGLIADHDRTAEAAEAAVAVTRLHRFLLNRLDRCLDLPVDELPCEERAIEEAEQRWAHDAAVVHAVREIFAEVLGVEAVGERDSFFELGGTSLTVAKVVSRARQRLGTAPSFADVLEHPTPAALARALRDSGPPSRPVLERRPPVTELRASPQQVRYFLSYNIDPDRSGRITVLLDEWEDAEAFRTAVASVVRRHELLRTGFFTDDAGRLHQRILPSAEPDITDVRLDAEDPAERRAELDALMRTHTFDLASPPLLKVFVDPRPDGGATAAVGVFSGILDAYSQGTLARELRTSYEAVRQGRPAELPSPKLQYQDFCRWQQERADSPEFATARSFWEERYPAGHPGFHLPATGGERAGAMRMFLLGEDLSEQARKAAASCGSSLFGFLLANFFERAADLYGRDDVSVGVLYHGRESEELADLVGYFVDLFCLRCDIRRPEGFWELVRRVNQELFQAVDARVYQYQDLSAHLGGSPTDPVFPVTGFHVNNVIVPGRTEHVGPDFATRVLDLPYRPKFDFNIYVHESDRGILIRMAYATTVVSHERAAALAEDFVREVRRNVEAVVGGAS